MAVWLEIVKLTPPWLLPFVIVVAVLVILFLMVRAVVRAWPTIKQFVLTVNAITGLPEFMERTDQKIAEIHHETHKNDGSSIKDSSDRTELAVGRVEEGVAGLHERVAAVETSLAGVHGRLDDVDRELTTLTAADDEIREDAAELRREFDNTRPKTEIHPPQGET